MELCTAKTVPGAGEHSPDYRALKMEAPKFGFGTSKRNNTSLDK